MKLAPDIAAELGDAVRHWAESHTALPLLIEKKPNGAILRMCLPKQRYTKGEFAAELNMSRGTFSKLEKDYGLQPAKSDGCYDRETVEDAKRWLKNEEDRGDKAAKAQRVAISKEGAHA